MGEREIFKETIELLQDKVEELREVAASGEAHIRQLDARLKERDDRIRSLIEQSVKKDASVQRLTRELQEVYESKTWKIGQSAGRLVERLRLRNSAERALRLYDLADRHLKTHLRILKSEGLGQYLKYSFEHRKRQALSVFGKGGAVPGDDRTPPGVRGRDSSHLSELREILRRHAAARGIIVFPPTADWNIPLYQRPQHMATYLSRRGYLFFYCTEKTVADVVNGFQRLSENCYLTDQFDLIVRNVKGFIFDLYCTQQTVGPELLSRLGRDAIVIYEYIDHIHEHISGKKAEFILARHRTIEPDIVFASARGLYEEMVSRFGAEAVAYLPNAVEYGHFHIARDEKSLPPDMEPIVRKNHPVIGYYGALAQWLDYGLINELAAARPGYEIVLIGWDYDKSMRALRKRDNVHYLGTKPYDLLPRYAVWFDVAVIPFVEGELADATSPLKLFEYMALGKPVVTTNMGECKRYQSVIAAKTPEEFISTIDKALDLGNDEAYLKTLDREALDNTWEARAEEYDRMVQSVVARRSRERRGVYSGEVKGRVSVVLPVYNQAGYLRDAIEGVLGQTYPDIELIVVNDGSTDGVERVLDDYVAHPRVKVFTQDNQKLPKALNNGFAHATGEYLTWTSADNIMLPRQIEELVKALRADQRTALVFSDYQAIDDRGLPLSDRSFRPQNQDRDDPSIMRLPDAVTFENLHDSGDNFIGPSFLYRRWAARIIGDYAHDTFGGEDYDYWLRVSSLFPVVHVGAVLYQYRVHDNTLNARARELRIFDNVQKVLRRDRERRELYERPLSVVTVGFGEEGQRALPSGKVLLLFTYSRRGDATVKDLLGKAHVAAVCAADTEVDEFSCEDPVFSAADFVVATDPASFELLDSAHTGKVFSCADIRKEEELCAAMANSCLSNRQWGIAYDKVPAVPYAGGRRLKVALQIDSLDKGGMEQVLHDLAVHLNRDRFEVIVIVVKKNGLTGGRLASKGIPVVEVEGDMKTYLNALRDNGVDIVNTHFSYFGLEKAAAMGITVVETIHNNYTWLTEDEAARVSEIGAAVARFVAVSRQVKNCHRRKFGLSPGRVEVIPNGLNPEGLDLADPHPLTRESLGFRADDFIFLNVASFSTVKAHGLMVAAMKDLVRDYPAMKLVLVGDVLDRELFGHVRSAIETHRLGDAVRVLDFMEKPRLGSLYGMADCFLLPSFQEGWSISAMEAMYFGLPLIASDIGSARDIIADGDIGIIVRNPYDDIALLSSSDLVTMSRQERFSNLEDLKAAMVSQYADRTRWRDKARAGRQKVRERFSSSGMVRRYEELFVRTHFVGRKGGIGAGGPAAEAGGKDEPFGHITYDYLGIDPRALYDGKFMGDGGADPRNHMENPKNRFDVEFSRVRFVADRIRGGRVLDLGCGTGPYGKTLKDYAGVSELVGIDMDRKALEKAALSYDRTHVFELQKKLPFDDGYFDAVFSVDFFGHVEFRHKKGLIGEVHRVTRPGGLSIHVIEFGNIDYSRIDPADPQDKVMQYVRMEGHVGIEPAERIRERWVEHFEILSMENAFIYPIYPLYTYLVDKESFPQSFRAIVEGSSARERELAQVCLGFVNDCLKQAARDIDPRLLMPADLPESGKGSGDARELVAKTFQRPCGLLYLLCRKRDGGK